MTGLALIAYTVFAFAAGAALGAVLRRVSWAIVGTVALYVAVAVLMVLLVRPSLSSIAFLPIHESNTGQGVGDSSNVPASDAWNLGFGYRYVPGVTLRSQMSANAAGNACERHPTTASYLNCLSVAQIQQGTFYQPANRYWTLQWREAVLLVLAAAALLGWTVWTVRRWRA